MPRYINTLTLLSLMLATSGAAAPLSPITTGNETAKSSPHSLYASELKSSCDNRQPISHSPARADEETFPVSVGVMADSSRDQEVRTVFALSTDREQPLLIEAQPSGTVYKMDLPAGSYDIVAYVMSDNDDCQIFLFKENEVVDSRKTIILNQREAKIVTEVLSESPEGTPLRMPTADNPGNCSIADYLLLLRHNDYGTILQDENVGFRNVCSRIAINVIPEHFTFTRMDAFSYEKGPVYICLPIDPEKESNGPDRNGWHMAEANFHGTPMTDAYNALQEKPLFAMTGFYLLKDGYCSAYVGMGNDRLPLPTNRVNYYVPADYDNYYEYMPVLRDNLIIMPEASVTSMPYRLRDGELRPVGLNSCFNGAMMLEDGRVPVKGNPVKALEPYWDGMLGETTPALVCIPFSNDRTKWQNGFSYTYTGNYGEEWGINSFNFTDELSAEELDAIGGYRRELTVKCDGKTICNGPGEFYTWMDWGSGEEYEMDIRMWNVNFPYYLDEPRAENIAHLKYTSSDGYIPTITSLYIPSPYLVPIPTKPHRSDSYWDSYEHRLYLNFTAGTFRMTTTPEGRVEYEYRKPESVKLELSVHGTDNFFEVELEENDELFFLPGYGNYYEVRFYDIPFTWEGTWYDARLTVTGTNGAIQTQTILPAVLSPSRGDVANIGQDSHPTEGIYRLDGTRVADDITKLSPGIYIERKGSDVRKIRI